MLSDDVTAVHVSDGSDRGGEDPEKWEQWGEGVRLGDPRFALPPVLEPLLDYIEQVAASDSPTR